MGAFLAFKRLRKTAVKTKTFAPLSAPASRGITLRVFPRETGSVDDRHRFDGGRCSAANDSTFRQDSMPAGAKDAADEAFALLMAKRGGKSR
jgi:hypothetical protein